MRFVRTVLLLGILAGAPALGQQTTLPATRPAAVVSGPDVRVSAHRPELVHVEPTIAFWHISKDGRDVYPLKLRFVVAIMGRVGRWLRFVDLSDQVEATRRVFDSDTRWTVVRGSDLEEGDSQGLPAWSRHVGDPVLESNLTRRVDCALFMVDALTNDELVHEAPAIVGRLSPSGLAHAGAPVR